MMSLNPSENSLHSKGTSTLQLRVALEAFAIGFLLCECHIGHDLLAQRHGELEEEIRRAVAFWMLHSKRQHQAPALLFVASTSYMLLLSGRYVTQRDMYYRATQLFGSQRVGDCAVRALCGFCGGSVSRDDLHLSAAAKSIVVGNVSFTVIDCVAGTDLPRVIAVSRFGSSGLLLSTRVLERARHFVTTARFVLVVEKDAVMQRLVADHADSVMGCILFTGRGYPCVAGRRFLNLLHAECPELPIFALTDCDPHGVSILLTYALGSVTLRGQEQLLSVPAIQWLGVRPSQMSSLPGASPDLRPLTARDVSLCNSMLKRITTEQRKNSALQLVGWSEELKRMLDLKRKAEIEALFSLTSGASATDFLTQLLLSQKAR